MDYSPAGIADLVRPTDFDPRVYTDQEIFRLEMTRIFDRAWLVVGHESMVPQPGRFFVTRAGSRQILVTRAEDGRIRAFQNRCPHRGARLCSQDRGNTSVFVCPYHGWSFTGDGVLTGVPSPEEYPEGLATGPRGLDPVAALDAYRGFLFVRHTTEGPPLMEFLGDIKSSIDDLVDRAPDGEVEACPIPLRHRYRANWKLSFENLNDAHHARVAHASSARSAGQVLQEWGDRATHTSLRIMKANGMSAREFGQLGSVTVPYGHSYMYGFIDGQKSPSQAEEYELRLRAAKGDSEAERITSVNRHLTLLYPSATFQGRFQSLRLIHPISHDLTESVGYLFRLKGGSEKSFKDALEYFHISMSPFSPVVTDDFEIYEGTQQINDAPSAPPLPVTRLFDPHEADRKGRVEHRATSEAFIRNQYVAWKAYMCGDKT